MSNRLILYDKAWKAMTFQVFNYGIYPAITSQVFTIMNIIKRYIILLKSVNNFIFKISETGHFILSIG